MPRHHRLHPQPHKSPPPSLPTPPPALPGEEEVGLVADGGRKPDRVVLRRHLGAVAGRGETWPWGGREDPETPPQPPNLPPQPPHGVQPHLQPSYLPASRATSARSRRTEQLNSSSRVKETWGASGAVSGVGWVHGGGPGGCPGPLPWPLSGRRGSQRCRAGGDPPAPCTPASPSRCPAEGGDTDVTYGQMGTGAPGDGAGGARAEHRGEGPYGPPPGVGWGTHIGPSGPPPPTWDGLRDPYGAI